MIEVDGLCYELEWWCPKCDWRIKVADGHDADAAAEAGLHLLKYHVDDVG
jgi:hypothetical protein